MKRTALRHPKLSELPIAWSEAEYVAVLQVIAVDAFDDRVSEDIFDVEDERAAVESIVHGMAYGLN